MTDLFLSYLRFERNRSVQTIARYERALRDFESYFRSQDETLDWASVDADLIRGWMESLMDRGNIASTVNTGLSAVKSFFRFALARGLVESDPARHVTGPKKAKPLPQFLKESELDELIDRMEWGDDYKNVRARTIIILLYETGIRRGELTGLDDADVDLTARQLKVTGKRNKQRIIPFGEELAETISHYIEVRNRDIERHSSALFLDNRGMRMDGAQVYAEVRKQLSRVSTLKKRSPHVLRHTFATAMLNHDAGLESVRRLLGHESLETTEIYTHTTFEQLRRVYKETHPRGGEDTL